MSSNLETRRLPARSVPPRWQLSRGWRRTVLVAHIVSAGAWIGIDVVVAVLVLAGRFAETPTRGLAYQALGVFIVWPMFTAAAACLLTGLALGVGTRWGLARYWWVLVKLVLNAVLCVMILVLLEPGMAEVAAWGRRLPTTETQPRAVDTLFFPPAVSLSTLTLATALAVVKPWGPLRRPAGRDRAAPASARRPSSPRP